MDQSIKKERGWFAKAVTECIDTVTVLEQRVDAFESDIEVIRKMTNMQGFKDFDNMLHRLRMVETNVQTIRQDIAQIKDAVRRLSV